MNDLDPYQQDFFYEDEYQKKQRAEADRASTGLMMALFSLIFKLFFLLVLFCPGIFCAYLILSGLRSYTGPLKGWNFFGMMVGTVYVLECAAFMLKGWSISLKIRGHGMWLIPWIVCFLYCFGLPLLILHTFIFNMFRGRPGSSTDTLEIVSWIAGALISVYIYSRYKLQNDYAPIIFRWAYYLGRRMGD